MREKAIELLSLQAEHFPIVLSGKVLGVVGGNFKVHIKYIFKNQRKLMVKMQYTMWSSFEALDAAECFVFQVNRTNAETPSVNF